MIAVTGRPPVRPVTRGGAGVVPAPQHPTRRPAKKGVLWPFYLLFNLLLAGFALSLLAVNHNVEAGSYFYVILLGGLCSAPLLLTNSLRGAHSLSLIFFALYFYLFSIGDINYWLADVRDPTRAVDLLLSDAELLILLSAVCFLLGYAGATQLSGATGKGLCQRDWSPLAILFIGILFWACGFVAVYYIQTDFTLVLNHPFWGPLGGVVSLARLLNPLGALMLAYLYMTRGQRSALLLFCVFSAFDFALGFYGDTKEQAFRDPILFLMARFLVSGRIPVMLVGGIFLLAGLSFSFFSEYREVLHSGSNVSRWEAVGRVFDSFLDSTHSSSGLSDRFSSGHDYVTSRTTLKPSVQLIVDRTGKSVPFEEGRTISPLLYVFVPRNFMPEKPDATVGRKFNRAFKISADENTYISPSQNGELYWNFGWMGVVIGMTLIGFIIGGVNIMVDLSRSVTLPRLLILLVTIYQICLRFEDGIAIEYTYWLRAILLLLVVDFFMPKRTHVLPRARGQLAGGNR